MAGGYGTGGPGDDRGDSRGRRGGYEGLRRLGDEIEPTRRARRVANEEGLAALGSEVTGQPSRRRRKTSARVRRRRIIALGVAIVMLIVAFFGGSWLYLRYRFNQIPKITVSAEQAVISGQPFNVLVIGSDTRSGLTGSIAAQAQDPNNPVTGQRSDVIMIWHIDPKTKAITVMSIPRDTMISAGTALSSSIGTFNRINTAYAQGPNTLVATIEANFGIPINHVVQVNFAGFVGAVNALGGVWMNFPQPARDAYSGLNITRSGCQLLDGTQALAVARSRHYEYYGYGRWASDPSSDFGRIRRQDAFLKALINSAKSKYNPLTINAFLGSIPQGITIDRNFGLTELIGLAVRYHSLDPNSIQAKTLPTQGVNGTRWGSVLFVDQPAAQEMLVSIFGNQLGAPTTPPPNTSLETPQPPVVTTTTAPPTTTTQKSSGSGSVTTTTLDPNWRGFDPTPCSPQ